MRVLTFFCVLLGCAFIGVASALGEATNQQCQSGLACFPWSNSGTASTNPCRRGGTMSLRFMLDVAKEGALVDDGRTYAQSIYAFCPRVDNVQAFTLIGAPFMAAAYSTKDGDKTNLHLTRSLSLSYLSVYGFGNSSNTFFPERGISAGSVVFAQNGTGLCVGGSRSAAVVTTLVLNVGLRKGLFNYAGATAGGMRLVANPNYNNDTCWALTHQSSSSGSSSSHGTSPAALPGAVTLNEAASATSSASAAEAIDYCSPEIEMYVGPDITQPLKTGFVPTCQINKDDEYVCMFDDSQLCIGNPGQKNCARCFSAANVAQLYTNATTQIWTSYYGTDSRGYTLKSGGLNPINFRKYARSGMLQTIRSKLHNLWAGNISFIFD